jgi:DNA-binding LacI/PurR family transcriptional regulator
MTVGKTRATLKQIAKMCGVSHTTVSMVINNNPRISEETRVKVLAAIKKYNYYPNVAARSLVMSRTNTIGIIGTLFHSPYYTEVIRGIEMESRRTGLDLKIYNCDGSLEEYKDLYDRVLGERRIDCVIAISVSIEDVVLERFLQAEMPLVVLQPVAERNRLLEGIPVVYTEDFKGMEKVVDHLISLGHRKVGFIDGPEYMKICQDRMHGYQQALKDRGIPSNDQFVLHSNLIPDPFTFDAGYTAARVLLNRSPELTAICCVSDAMALGTMKAARQKGRKIPEDLSVTGFDDTFIARLSDPSLTTLRQPLFEMGQASVSLAHAVLNRQTIDPIHRGFETELVIRESTVKPARS